MRFLRAALLLGALALYAVMIAVFATSPFTPSGLAPGLEALTFAAALALLAATTLPLSPLTRALALLLAAVDLVAGPAYLLAFNASFVLLAAPDPPLTSLRARLVALLFAAPVLVFLVSWPVST